MIKEVSVSNEDIVGSKPLDPCDCAIAKALNRAFKTKDAMVRFDIKEYSVDIFLVVNKNIYDKDKIINYKTITNFITRFDMGLKTKCTPFTFGVIL